MRKAMDDGGPAFPTKYDCKDKGMSLRDWFAGQALTGLLLQGSCDLNATVLEAFELADAMLKERERRYGDG